MVRKTIIFLMLFVSATLFANKTDTTVTFSNETYVGQDKHGNSLYDRDVTIKTTDFKVDNFWKKFSWSGSGSEQTSFDTITTSGKVRVSVESSYACENGGLDTQGCSGQKPFLINQGVLNNPDMKLDGLGDALPAGEYRIPLDAALNYNSSNDDAFYALDVYRDGKYYSEGSAEDAVSEKPKTFFGYLGSMFRDFFSKDINTYTTGSESPEQRNRYIANITFGHQKEYLLEKSSAVYTNEINTADSSKRVSLLDYNSQIIEQTTGCNGLFFSYDPDSLTCKGISFFGLSNFMPFINNTPDVKVKSDSVVEDTETTLLTLAGNLDGKNYLSEKTQVDGTSGKTTILSEMFKPITFMASSMFRFFFGAESKNITEMISAEFIFQNPMPLTFIETDGTSVTDFIHFSLLGLESIYGTEVESCTVQSSGSFFMFSWPSGKQTFTKGVATNTEFDMDDGGFFSSFFGSSDSAYSDLNITTKQVWFSTHDIVNVSTDDWLDWCKRNQGRQKKGLFGRMFEAFTSFTSFLQGTSEGGETYDDQLDNLLSDEGYSVDDYKEKVHKGLILHLKEVEGFAPGSAGTTSTYKLMNIQRGE